MRLFFHSDPGLVFNIGYTSTNCWDAIKELYSDNLLDVRRMNGEAVENWMDFTKFTHARDVNNKLVIGLTEKGGSTWEKLLKVDWSQYVSDVVFDEDAGRVRVMNLRLAHQILEKSKDCKELGSLSFEINTCDRVVYWKNRGGYQLSIKGVGGTTGLDEDVFWTIWQSQIANSFSKFERDVNLKTKQIFSQREN